MSKIEVNEEALREILEELEIALDDDVFGKIKLAIQLGVDSVLNVSDEEKWENIMKQLNDHIEEELSKTGISRNKFDIIWLAYQLKDSVARMVILRRD